MTVLNRMLATLITGIFIIMAPEAFAEATEKDAALWGGGLFLVEPEQGFNYSLEYQFRYSDNQSSLSAQFIEAIGYHKASPNLLLNGGYRFTERPDHSEQRLYLGGFLDLTKTSEALLPPQEKFTATLQFGYQRDFNTSYDDTLIDSNSIRWIVVASKPVTQRVKPFFTAGLLTTWNKAYNFGIEKIRLGVGLHYQLNEASRLRIQYMWEESRFQTPQKNSNILWMRYEWRFGH